MGKLVIERYSQWINSLPAGEADRVYLVRLDPTTGQEKMLTPRQALEEMKRGSPIGSDLQKAEELLLNKELELKQKKYQR